MFLRLIYLKNSTFPSVKTTVDTLIDVRNETSKHHFLIKISKIKYVTLLLDANVPVRFRAQQRAKVWLTQPTVNSIAAKLCIRHDIKLI